MDADLARRVTLGSGNGIGYAPLAITGYEIGQCHRLLAFAGSEVHLGRHVGTLLCLEIRLFAEAEDASDDISNNFDVLETMREVSDRYIEEHERKVKEINEKIRVLDEEKK